MKKKILTVLLASVIANSVSPAMSVYAEEVLREKTTVTEEEETTETRVKSFNLDDYSNFDEYNQKFRIKREGIKRISNNGGQYDNSSIDKAIDGNLSTYWETGNPNNSTFKNEVVVEFNELESMNRIAYATRQDSAKSKGYPVKFEIYSSETGDDKDLKLVSTGEHTATGELMEFKFKNIKTKKIKFKFVQAHNDWASASEFWFYKEDKTLDSMERIFKDSSRNTINEEFNSLKKLNKLEKAAKKHPYYEHFKEDINDAKYILEDEKVEYTNADVFKFKNMGTKELAKYDKIYKIDNKHIVNISTNGRHWADKTIDKAIDGKIDTYWHSDATNNENHTNEVVMTLDKIQTLDKIVYTSERERGFAKKFDIYISKTLSGDTFTKVTSGNSAITKDSIAIKFNPTEARRIKFVFRDGHEGWALASEFGLYKEDSTMDKINRLFTDNTMTQVSEEFKTSEKLDKLAQECKKHPYYEYFKEDLYNAKVLVEQGKIESSVAITNKLNILNNKEYLKQFRMPYENIKSIKSNAPHYSQQDISKAADNNIDTYWETAQANGKDWSNEVTVEFKKPVTINRVAYGARQMDRKGFLEKFEIYGSNTTKGDDYHLIATGSADSVSGLVEAKFKTTTFKRMKLKWIKSNQDWATLNEIMFFKEDKIADKVNNMFTDNLMNKLNENYDTLDEILALEKEVKSHLLEKELMETINMAKEVIKSPEQSQTNIYELESRGDSIRESQKRKVWNFQDWQPTGLAVKSGEKITVYVDTEKGEPTPKLVFKQMDSRHNGAVTINLQRGKNIITIPEVEVNDLRPGTAKAGVLYTVNPYTKEQQSRKPKLRIVGGVNYPHFIKGVDNDKEVLQELKDYQEKLKKDPQLPDVFDVFSDKTLVNVKATFALDWYTKNDKLPSQTADKSDETIREAMKYWGFDNSKDVNSDFNFRYVSMVKYLDGTGAFMNAANGITGFRVGEQAGALNVDTGWGFMHEMGHNFDTNNRTMVEVTNNMLPLHFQMIKGEASKISEQNLWESRIFPKVAKEDYSNNEWYPENDRSLLTHMAPFWQLQLLDNTFWPRLEQQFREKNIGGGSWDNIHQAMAIVASDIMKLDLKEHFARHGFYVNDATAKHMAQYSKPTKKLWYLNDNKYLNKGEGFNADVNCLVKSKLVGNTVKLDIKIDENNADSILGYEIIRDGKVIGFTTKNTFVDNNITKGTNHEYKVVAYDINLNTTEASTKAHQPQIETVGGLTLGLNEKFNPLDYVKATDYKGNKLDNVKVIGNVDTTKQGDYTITYEVNDDGAISRETMRVNVVSAYEYLSDKQWVSATTEYGSVTANNSIKGRTLGEIKDYQKGIRVHANGKVVYDLSDSNYDNLELKVGVDMNLAAQENSSIAFKVIGDGKVLATTKVIKHKDDLQYINVPVKGVKNLVIEINDGGNYITSDHGIIVEPKLTTNNAKPSLKIPKSQTVKVGEKLDDLIGSYEALDAEDGNLTEQVIVTGQDKVNFNRAGNYTINYTVVDKDGNKVQKSRVISVINTEDFQYLSDIKWKSATTGWGEIGKDVSVDRNKIRLTDKDGNAVTYDKGLGTHSHSEIVYDLTDKNAKMFSAYVGVDREMYNSPSSIEFKVYVDGKEKFNSGIMYSTDSQKFVEVDLSGAKELKLVATIGDDGDGSDHADWADAKLYFVNTNRVYTSELEKSVENANTVIKENYTEESIKILEDKLVQAQSILENKSATQEEIDKITSELEESIKNLVEINLDEVVNIPDKYLVSAINKALGENDNLTIGDMRKLTNLNLGYGVRNLEGLQYAINLEKIDGEKNEVRDLRAISKLKKLKTINFNNQYVEVGELNTIDNKIKINTEVYNIAGDSVATSVELIDMSGNLIKKQAIDKGTKEVELDVTGVNSGYYRIHVNFEDSNFSGMLLYMTKI